MGILTNTIEMGTATHPLPFAVRAIADRETLGTRVLLR
jgi:hypothetical protein